MKANVGNSDRSFRIVLGIVLILLGALVVHSTIWTVIFLVVGILMLFTGLTRICLAYIPFGVKTNKKEEKPPETA